MTMWVSPALLARAIITATLPPSAFSGFQTHMPFPWGMTGGGGGGGGGGTAISVVVVPGGAVSPGAGGAAFLAPCARGVTGVTTPSRMGWGLGTRESTGTAGGGAPGAPPPWAATAALASTAKTTADSMPAPKSREGIAPVPSPPPTNQECRGSP